MNYIITGNSKNEDSLMHYGVLGMHWGVRRFQPYSTVPRGSGKKGDDSAARLFSDRKVKKLEKYRGKLLKTANEEYKRDNKTILKRDSNLSKKRTKLLMKGDFDGDKVNEKVAKKLDENAKKITKNSTDLIANNMAYKQAMEKIQNMSLSELNDYKIEEGKRKIYSFSNVYIFGLAGAAINTLIDNGSKTSVFTKDEFNKIYEEAERGAGAIRKDTQKTGDQRRIQNKRFDRSTVDDKQSYSSDEQKSKLSNAKKKDVYDLNFLEAVQNTKFEYDNDKVTRDKEYAIYLKDPENYWERARKLKQA